MLTVKIHQEIFISKKKIYIYLYMYILFSSLSLSLNFFFSLNFIFSFSLRVFWLCMTCFDSCKQKIIKLEILKVNKLVVSVWKRQNPIPQIDKTTIVVETKLNEKERKKNALRFLFIGVNYFVFFLFYPFRRLNFSSSFLFSQSPFLLKKKTIYQKEMHGKTI